MGTGKSDCKGGTRMLCTMHSLILGNAGVDTAIDSKHETEPLVGSHACAVRLSAPRGAL
jgi:hypothetical protein